MTSCDKKFSIVFPTRERVGLLQSILDSIQSTVSDISRIEVLVAVDDDDLTTRAFIDSMPGYGFVQWHFVKRSLNFSRDYYSFLAHKSTGRWIIAVNDDGRFETPNWDIMADKILNEYVGDGPSVVHGWIEDHLGNFRAKGHGKYCCFPLVGRDGFEALGCIFPANIPTWGADLWIRKLYDAVDRVVELPMTIGHYCHHNGTRAQDAVSKRIANNQVGYDINPTYDQINALLSKLRTYVCKAT